MTQFRNNRVSEIPSTPFQCLTATCQRAMRNNLTSQRKPHRGSRVHSLSRDGPRTLSQACSRPHARPFFTRCLCILLARRSGPGTTDGVGDCPRSCFLPRKTQATRERSALVPKKVGPERWSASRQIIAASLPTPEVIPTFSESWHGEPGGETQVPSQTLTVIHDATRTSVQVYPCTRTHTHTTRSTSAVPHTESLKGGGELHIGVPFLYPTLSQREYE